MSTDRDYVLGTHDDEVARLGLQHRVWRARALDAWRRAGLTVGQTVLDVGCGPGYATVDLAEIVGPAGKVVAVDRSRRFLDVLEASRGQRRLDQVQAVELDLDEGELPQVAADLAWGRWVFAFVKHPRRLLERIAAVLKPGGALVLHEYFHYATWRLAPRSPEHEEFVAAVMASWRAHGGEPDIALAIPEWLDQLGFEARTLQPLVDVVRPADHAWQWPKSFIEIGLKRLVDLGYLTAERAGAIAASFAAREALPGTRMITPSVLEIVAFRR